MSLKFEGSLGMKTSKDNGTHAMEFYFITLSLSKNRGFSGPVHTMSDLILISDRGWCLHQGSNPIRNAKKNWSDFHPLLVGDW